MEELIYKIVKQFNFKLKFFKKSKYMYICSTDKGIKVIKQTNIDCEKIIFLNDLKTHLCLNGFYHIDNYNITSSGLPYVNIDDAIYIMTDYNKDGEEYEFCDIFETRRVIETVARLHKATIGFDKSFKTKKNVTILDVFEKKQKKLKDIKRFVNKQKNMSEFDFMFIKNFQYFYEKTQKSIEILKKYNYNDLNLNKQCQMICHNNLKEENIIISKEIFLINFENVAQKHYINDLAMFILRYIRKHGKEFLSLNEILDIYNKINPIENKYLPILYAILNFPERYIDICKSFYDKKRSFTPISIANQFENILKLKEYHLDYIKAIK